MTGKPTNYWYQLEIIVIGDYIVKTQYQHFTSLTEVMEVTIYNPNMKFNGERRDEKYQNIGVNIGTSYLPTNYGINKRVL